jgi:hypothetical protein
MTSSSDISYDTNATYTIYYNLNNLIPKGGLLTIKLPP